MPRLLHLLLTICVLWCGMHLAEPVQAHDGAAHLAFEAQPDEAGGGSDDKHPATSAHAVQHHCPVALDRSPATAVGPVEPGEDAHFAAPAAELASRAEAPPVDPPTA